MKKIFAKKAQVVAVFLRCAGLALGRRVWSAGSKLAGRAWRLLIRVTTSAITRGREFTPRVARWLVIALRTSLRAVVADLVAGFALGIILARETIRLAVWILRIPVRALLWIYRKDPVFIKALIKGQAVTVGFLAVFPGAITWLLGFPLLEILLATGLSALFILPTGGVLMAIPFLPEEEIVPPNNHALVTA